MKRRDFLRHLGAGSAVLCMPAFLAGCGVVPASDPRAAAPDNPFMTWFGIDTAAIARIMSELTVNGADTADLYFQRRRENVLTMEEGILGEPQSDIIQGVGLRAVRGEQTGFAFTEELAMPSMLAAARIAAESGNGGAASTPLHFSRRETADLYRTELPWSEVGDDQKLALIERVDHAARASDPSITNVSIHWTDSDERVLIATQDGFLANDQRPMTRLSVQITAARGGEAHAGFASISARDGMTWYSDERVEKLVEQAVDRTLIQFDARRPPSGDWPVILASGTSGILLHEAIGHGLEGDLNDQGRSPWAGMIGERVAEAGVTIVDQGTIPHQRGALNVDDEGCVGGRTVLVDDGVLRSYVHDSISARKHGVPPTGNGRRESYRHAPMPRMTCTFIEDGPHTRDDIVASVELGIIAETYTGGRVDISSGDFSFDVKNGWLVERGRVTAPLRDITLSGNGAEALRRISMVADDSQFDPGGWTCGKNGQRVPVSQGMPTVLVSTMAVRDKSPA